MKGIDFTYTNKVPLESRESLDSKNMHFGWVSLKQELSHSDFQKGAIPCRRPVTSGKNVEKCPHLGPQCSKIRIFWNMWPMWACGLDIAPIIFDPLIWGHCGVFFDIWD